MKKLALALILLCSCGVDYAAMPYTEDAGAPDIGTIDAGTKELPWCCNAACYGTNALECERSWYDICLGSPNWFCAYSCERDSIGLRTGRGWETCSPEGGVVDTGTPNCKCRT